MCRFVIALLVDSLLFLRNMEDHGHCLSSCCNINSVRLQRKIVGGKKPVLVLTCLSVCLSDAYTKIVHPTKLPSMFASRPL
jgi:hypothetical protein